MRRMPIMLRVVSGGAVVPSLWRLEVANVLRNAVRRGRCDEAYVDRSLDRLGRFPVEVDDETSIHAWTATRALSREQGLTSTTQRISSWPSASPSRSRHATRTSSPRRPAAGLRFSPTEAVGIE